MPRLHTPHVPRLAYEDRRSRMATSFTGRFGAKAGLDRWIDSFCYSDQGRQIAANQRSILITTPSPDQPPRKPYTRSSYPRICIMVLGILTAIAACPAIIGTTEAVRQGQRQSAKEKHRGLKTNLSVNCSRTSSGGREIDGCAVVLSNNKVRRAPSTKP